jgi:hypothetical protein
MESLQVMVGELRGKVANIETRMISIDAKLDGLIAADNRRQGAWKTVAVAGGFAGAAVAFIANAVKDMILKG